MRYDLRGSRAGSGRDGLLSGDTPPGGGQGEGRAFIREESARHRPADRAGNAGKGMGGEAGGRLKKWRQERGERGGRGEGRAGERGSRGKVMFCVCILFCVN